MQNERVRSETSEAKIDQQYVRMAERMVQRRLRPRDTAIRTKVERLEFSARQAGTVRLTFYADEVCALLLDELRARADIIWQCYREVISAVESGWDAALGEAVLDRVRQQLETDTSRLEEDARRAIAPHGHSFSLFLSEARPEIISDVAAAIELFSTGRRPRQHSLTVLLGAPRYAGPLEHWNRSTSAAAAANPDWMSAAREAVSAVEALAKTVTGMHSATLGDCLKELRGSGRVHPGVVKAIEGVWGFANTTPGLRHGSQTSLTISRAEAEFVISSCEPAARLLLELDAGRA